MTTIAPILFAIFAFVFLPGLVVEIQTIRVLYKAGHKDSIWEFLNPLTLVLMCVLGYPVLSFAFYSLLFVPAAQRATVLHTALQKMDTDSIQKTSIVRGLAATFGIRLE